MDATDVIILAWGQKTLIAYVHALKLEAKWQENRITSVPCEARKKYILDRKYRREIQKLIDKNITPLRCLRNVSHVKSIWDLSSEKNSTVFLIALKRFRNLRRRWSCSLFLIKE